MADADNEGGRSDDETRDRIDVLLEAWDISVANLEQRYRIVARMCLASCALALLTLVGTVVVVRHEGRLRQNAQLRAIGYRVCQREAVDRAFAHAVVDRERLPYVEARLPILDCTPNLTGEPATPLTINMQRQFVARFDRGELTLRQQGICRERIPEEPDEPVC